MRQVLPYALVILVILGVGYWIHYHGYRSGVDATVARYESMILKERERVQSANDAALEAARRVEQQLRTQLGARNETIRQLIADANAHPDALSQCIDADGVHGLNRID